MVHQSVLILDLDVPNCHTKNLERITYAIEENWQHKNVVLFHQSNLDFENSSTHPTVILIRESPTTLASQTLSLVRRRWPEAKVIGLFCAEHDSFQEVSRVLEKGLDDFLFCPYRDIDIVPRVHRALSHSMPITKYPQSSLVTYPNRSPLLIGENHVFCQSVNKASLVAGVDVNVLISGETGTGKEVIARLLHDKSARSENPFVPVNCGAIPDQLFENEIFGHSKGAFTGAIDCEKGLLAEAEGGTLFLDEIDSLSLVSQGKLLRFFEHGEFRPLGSSKIRKADVRVIAATNQDLERKIEEGSFRSDLFYRLNVTRLSLPPLRDRKEDIRLLLDYFLNDVNARYGLQVQGFTVMARHCLEEHSWPGNVRELKNLVESLVITLGVGNVQVKDLPKFLQRKVAAETEEDEKERELLLTTLRSTKWNRTKAAHELHWSRMTLYRKIEKYHLDIPAKRRSPKTI